MNSCPPYSHSLIKLLQFIEYNSVTYLDGDCDIAVGIWELGEPSSIIPKLEDHEHTDGQCTTQQSIEAAMEQGVIIKRIKEKQTQGDTSSTR